MSRIVVAVVAALVVGVGLGYLAGSGQSPSLRSDSDRRTGPDSDPSVESQSLEQYCATVPVPAVPMGTGTLQGTVRTPEGKPIPDVLIVALPFREAPGGIGTDHAMTLEESVRDQVARFRWSEKARRKAVTDETGSFELNELADVEYALHASCEGYEIRLVDRRHRGGYKPGETVAFVATPCFELTVDVLMPDGSRPSEARIQYRGQRRGSERWTPDRPTIRIQQHVNELVAIAGDRDELRSSPQRIELEVGREVPILVFRLSGRPGLHGRVIVPPDLDLAGVRVHAKRFAGDQPPPDATLPGSKQRAYARQSDGYRFSLKDLEPGRHLVGVSVDARTIETSLVVDVPDHPVEITIRLPAPDTAGYVEVQVVGPDGEKVRNASLTCYYRGEGFMGGGGTAVLKRRDGSYLVRPVDAADHGAPEGGTHLVKVTSRDYGTLQQEYDPEEVEPIVFRFQEPATLHVTLEGYVGSGHEGMLRLRLQGRDQRHFPTVGRDRFDAEGHQSLGPLQPGEDALVLGVADHRFFRPVAEIPVQLESGENRVTVPVPKLYTLRIHGPPGERLGISSEIAKRLGLWGAAPVIGDDGVAVLERIPAGKYEIHGNRDGEKWVIPIVVPAQAEVRIE